MPTSSRTRWLAINYAATIFLSAFLLFQVQPLVSKYILPWFGGSPAVWTTCMLFFQTLLFGGYAYAHFLSQRLQPGRQAALHLAVILTALVLVLWGVVPNESWKPNESGDPIGRILLLLAASVGLPYFVLSTTGPLVQAWFARSFPGKTPYRLYALSNIGSLLALLSYPVFFERIFAVQQQAVFWSWGFAAFAILCGVAALWIWKAEGENGKAEGRKQDEQFGVDGLVIDPSRDREGAEPATLQTANTANVPPNAWQRALWLLLPAAASTTLLATTNHICTDVAVMPFLWVAPLSLYLLTFIVAFDHPRWYRPGLIAAITMLAIYGATLGIGGTDLYKSGYSGQAIHWVRNHLATWQGVSSEQFPKTLEISIGLAMYLTIDFIAMFGTCLLCHGELVRLRPHPRYLTSFYLMISAGGALGGLLVTLVAPHIFKTYFEWELATYFGFLLAMGLLIRSIVKTSSNQAMPSRSVSRLAIAVPVLLLGALAVADMTDYLKYPTDGVLLRTRNFFGTLLVREFDTDKADHCIIFKHGATTHGLQYANQDRRCEPTTYYTEFGGAGRTLNYLHGLPQAPALLDDDDDEKREKTNAATNVANIHEIKALEHAHAQRANGESDKPRKGLKIGAVGLGAGTLATYVAPGDSISFYEINPQVIDIAQDARYFTFLSDCKARGAQCEVKLGDARLTLERELNQGHPQHYDLLVLDAFSGDAIPAHLLTEDAFKIYEQHMANEKSDSHDGTIAIHIQNHYVNLEPVARGIAERFGYKTVRIESPYIKGQGILHSNWVILTRNPELLAALKPFAAAPETAQTSDEHAKPAVLWTDGQNNLFDVLK